MTKNLDIILMDGFIPTNHNIQIHDRTYGLYKKEGTRILYDFQSDKVFIKYDIKQVKKWKDLKKYKAK